jgi:ubiquinone/menaquinone biosynthesis C-methylase UbiE
MHLAKTRPVDHGTWERAEVVRSDIEAANTAADSLRIGARKAQRYRNPPADTCFPLEYAYHLVGDVTGRSVLDIGCGSGMNSALLAFRGARVTGIDISPSLVELAVQRARINGIAERTRFLVTSAHDLPFPDRSFDLVVGIAILHHLDVPLVARETLRILKPGGRAVFQEPVRNSALVRAIRPLIPYRAPDISPFERPLTDAEIDAFSSGFTRGRRRAFCLPFVNLMQVLPGANKYVDRAYRLDAQVLRRFPRLRTYASNQVFEIKRPAIG